MGEKFREELVGEVGGKEGWVGGKESWMGDKEGRAEGADAVTYSGFHSHFKTLRSGSNVRSTHTYMHGGTYLAVFCRSST